MEGIGIRITTAIFFVLIMLGGIFGGPNTFIFLTSLITVLSLWEFLGLVLGPDHYKFPIRSFFGLLLGYLPVLLMALYQLGKIPDNGLLLPKLFILYTLCLFLLFIIELFIISEQPFRNLAFILLGILYIGLPFALFILIAFPAKEYQYSSVLGLVLLIWVNDTGAYFAGSRFGKTKLFPRISPKKTWEGSAGGLVSCLLVGYFLSRLFPLYSLIDWLILAVIVSVFGSLGDLVESMLKRSIKIKDSGNILPGHGGLLDRFDGLIFAIPFAVAYLLLIAS